MPLAIEFREDQHFTIESVRSLYKIIINNYPFSTISPEDAETLQEIENASKNGTLTMDNHRELQRIGSIFLSQVNQIYKEKNNALDDSSSVEVPLS